MYCRGQGSLDHRKFNEGDGETFFQKVMYQLALSLARKYGYPNTLRLFHGRRDSRYELGYVKEIINSGLARERMVSTYTATYRPVRQFDYMQVGTSGPHQLADTLLARRHSSGTSANNAEGEAERGCWPSMSTRNAASRWGERSPMSKPHFDIWTLRLR